MPETINDAEIPLIPNNEAIITPPVEENVCTKTESRYPQRNKSEPKYLKEYVRSAVDICYKISDVPTTYSQVMQSEDAREWQLAMQSEFNSLKENEVFTVVPLPKGKKVIGSR